MENRRYYYLLCHSFPYFFFLIQEMLKKTLLAIISFYQKFVSPLLGQHCRFEPSCSEYSSLAIKKCGIIKGGALSIWRVLRCNPWGRGGVDLP